ncbi:NUDIX hydrolase [Hymenobacter sp. RP-2-7]|uniref:NUDIX hydrolase n=1 Tax=Hymenobacter polaris TaxID=2682546 RepID=A0A7Y0ACE3_9BACT|nr:NUDIX hydrolase [Hymenobacter polaris]NML64607.1 NUDIX hydrolase [Hymenobacter polaris]
MSTDSDSLSSALLTPYQGQVRVRVGGLLVRDGAILLAAHRGLLPGDAPFWSPPGGGWVFGEGLKDALRREFAEETGLAVHVGRQLHLHEFRERNLQALEIFFAVTATDPTATPRLGHDPEHGTGPQLLVELAWLTPRQLLQLPLAQVHPVLRGLLSPDDIFVPQVLLGA